MDEDLAGVIADFLSLTPPPLREAETDDPLESYLPKEPVDVVTAGDTPLGLVNAEFEAHFLGILKLHHTYFSAEPFSKDRFEYALVRIARQCGLSANLAPRGNPGHDAVVERARFSLKTQANQGIKDDEIHISKFMELGRGEWTTNPDDLIGLRAQFLEHMEDYDRILILRSLGDVGPGWWHYELVEIPKPVLQRALSGRLEMRTASSQVPRPGSCRVLDDLGLVFELYFDGGAERKLQVRHLRKSACVKHADWRFFVEEV